MTQPPFRYHNGNGDNPQRSLQQVASGRRDVRRSSREEFQKIFGQFYSPHHELEITQVVLNVQNLTFQLVTNRSTIPQCKILCVNML